MFSNLVRVRVALGAHAIFAMSLSVLAILDFDGSGRAGDSNLNAPAGTDVPGTGSPTDGLGSAQSLPPIEPSPGSEADGLPPFAGGVAVGEPHPDAPPSSSPLAPAGLEPAPVTECGPDQNVVMSNPGGVVCLEPGDSMPPDPTSMVVGQLPALEPTLEPHPETR